MRRDHAANNLAAEIARLRGHGPMPEKHVDQAREVAALWLEQDARRCLLDRAPPEAEAALRAEYVQTQFMHERDRVFDNGHRLLAAASVADNDQPPGAKEG